MKGTSRTLDEVDGAMELEDGILSKAGYALLDDSSSYLYDVESGFRARPCPEVDLYFFGYGRDYLGALKDFYHLTGQPLSCHVMLWETGGVGIGLIPVRSTQI